MPFDAAFIGCHYEDALAFIAEILQASTEYYLVGWNLDDKLLLLSEGARRLFGYEAAEVLGKAGLDALQTPEDIASGLPGKIAALALRSGKWEGMLTPVRKSGVVKGLAMGAARYLCRPIEVDVMLAEIWACLSEKAVN